MAAALVVDIGAMRQMNRSARNETFELSGAAILDRFRFKLPARDYCVVTLNGGNGNDSPSTKANAQRMAN
jgi:hypothetical protein